MIKNIIGATFLATAIAGSGSAQQTAAPDTMIVLDVSNSMWGQINGVPKFEIARNVIGDLVQNLGGDGEYGLIAYGHRRKSDCADIELLIPIGPLDANAFSAAVNSLVPRGRTPLTDAVRTAAQVMNYTESAARIILVSDGLESCDADPCALAAELEAAGLDFTTHVVGFDVSSISDQSQLSCLADETGGLYMTAETTEELTAALEVMATPPEVETPPVMQPTFTLVAVDAAGNIINNEAIGWAIENLTDNDYWLRGQVSASVTVEYQADSYRGSATLGDRKGMLEFQFDGMENATFEIVLSAAATLEAVSEASAGSFIEVTWTGPDDEADYINIAPVGGAVDQRGQYTYTRDGSPLQLKTIDQVGDFELRYMSGQSNVILATRPITLTEPALSLNATENAVAGATIVVTWVGPDNQNDYIKIVPLGAEENNRGNYIYTRKGNPLNLQTVDRAGEFEIRYVSGQSNQTMASISITLTAPEVSLSAAPVAFAGNTVSVVWVGPDNQNDYIALVPAGQPEGTRGVYAYTRRGDPASINVPDDVGDYQIRYVSGQSNTTLASINVSVVAE